MCRSHGSHSLVTSPHAGRVGSCTALRVCFAVPPQGSSARRMDLQGSEKGQLEKQREKNQSLFLLANIREHSLQDAIQDKGVALLTYHPRGPCHHWFPAVGTRLVGDKGLNLPLTQLSLRRESGQRSLKPACDPVVQAGNGASGTACEIHHHLLAFVNERLMPRCTQPGLVGSAATEVKVLCFLSESWSGGGHRQADLPIRCDRD